MLDNEHIKSYDDSSDQPTNSLRMVIDNKQLRSMLEDERARTAALNEKLISMEELNRGMEMVIEKLKQNPLAFLPECYARLLPTSRSLENASNLQLESYDDLYTAWQEYKVQNEEMSKQISELQQRILEEQQRRAQLEQGIDRDRFTIKQLQQTLNQEQCDRSHAIMEAVESEYDRYNRQIEQLASMYDNNQRILINNLKMLQESMKDKLELAQRQKEKMEMVMEQLQRQVQVIMQQLDKEKGRVQEKNFQVEKLNNRLYSQQQKSTLTQHNYNDELGRRQIEIQKLRNRLNGAEEFCEYPNDQRQRYEEDASDRFDAKDNHIEEHYEQVIEENRKLKELIATYESQQQTQKMNSLTKVKSFESLNILRQLQNGHDTNDAFKFNWRNSDHEARLSLQPDQEEQKTETLNQGRDVISRLRNSIDNAERQKEKLVTRHEEVVAENTRVMNLYLKEQEDRLAAVRQKQELETRLNQTNTELSQIKEELMRANKYAVGDNQRLKTKLSFVESALKQKQEELSVLRQLNKNTKSKIKSKDDGYDKAVSNPISKNLLTEVPCELQLSPREKDLIRLRRQVQQLTHEITQLKNSNSLAKNELHKQLQKSIRKAVDMKIEYWQLHQSHEILMADYEQLRQKCKSLGLKLD